MKKKIILTTSIAFVLLIFICAAIYFLIPREVAPDVNENKEPLYLSMEDDGSVVTEEDIKEQAAIENFARGKAIEYFKKTHPDSSNVLIQSVEWYFTDDDDLNNLLVTASIVQQNGSILKDMIVLKISDSKPLRLLETYMPDERYLP